MRNFDLSLTQWLLDPTANFSLADQVAPNSEASYSPSVDIRESEKAFTLSADLPGVAPASIEVTVLEGILRLKGERAASAAGPTDSVQLRERPAGEFERSFRLPKSVSVDEIAVQAGNGVIEITIPKVVAAGRRRIEVQGLVAAAAGKQQSAPTVQSTA